MSENTSLLTPENKRLAEEIISRYPVKRSALGPLLHLYQSQEGYVSDEAVAEAAGLVGISPAMAMGMCSFYEMFKRSPGGKYRINICQGISCHLNGAQPLIDFVEETLEIRPGETTADGMFSLETVECIAACTEAPCLQTNYRYHYRQSREDFTNLVEQLRSGELAKEIPEHGTLSRMQQDIPSKNKAGTAAPSDSQTPDWIKSPRLLPAGQTGGSPNKTGDSLQKTGDSPQKTSQLILTSRFESSDSHTLEGYLKSGGYAGLKKALSMEPSKVHDEVRDASLLGRGGAGFPAGVKWSFCPPDVWPRYLVVNGDESEPGTYKDRMLVEEDPHQLIEGCLIACYAMGLRQCFLYLRGEMAFGAERLISALNEAYRAGFVGKNILDTNFSVDIILHQGAGAYIVGEETALLESLEGERGMPRLKPPRFPAADGLYGKPTIVNNVETISNLSWIVLHGADGFKKLGAEVSAGTRMFAVSGHVKNPGVFEVPFGRTTFRDLIFDYAGGLRDGASLKAIIPGGASSPWFTEAELDLPLEKEVVDKAGSMLGSGAVIVMDNTTDIVKVAHNLVRFFAHESCGKCTPCREGTAWLEQVLFRILNERGRKSDLDLLLDVSDNISPGLSWPAKMTTICPLGPSAVAVVVSALKYFRNEFEDYIARAPKYLEELQVVSQTHEAGDIR